MSVVDNWFALADLVVGNQVQQPTVVLSDPVEVGSEDRLSADDRSWAGSYLRCPAVEVLLDDAVELDHFVPGTRVGEVPEPTLLTAEKTYLESSQTEIQ